MRFKEHPGQDQDHRPGNRETQKKAAQLFHTAPRFYPYRYITLIGQWSKQPQRTARHLVMDSLRVLAADLLRPTLSATLLLLAAYLTARKSFC